MNYQIILIGLAVSLANQARLPGRQGLLLWESSMRRPHSSLRNGSYGLDSNFKYVGVTIYRALLMMRSTKIGLGTYRLMKQPSARGDRKLSERVPKIPQTVKASPMRMSLTLGDVFRYILIFSVEVLYFLASSSVSSKSYTGENRRRIRSASMDKITKYQKAMRPQAGSVCWPNKNTSPNEANPFPRKSQILKFSKKAFFVDANKCITPPLYPYLKYSQYLPRNPPFSCVINGLSSFSLSIPGGSL